MFYELLKRQYILQQNEAIKIVLMPFQEEEKSSTPTKTKEVVDRKRVTIKDSTGEVDITLWRNQASLSLPVGTWQLISDLKLNIHNGRRSFNSSYKTQALVS